MKKNSPDYKIYGLMRVRNEEDIIINSLNHLTEFCTGGIFVFDDCSTDNTVKLSKSFPNVKTVIENRIWNNDREKAKYENRAELLTEVKKYANEDDWLVYVDADERIDFDWNILSELKSDVLAIRMKLFDFYITAEDINVKFYERKWLGPEYREIIFAFRNLPTLSYTEPDQREVNLGRPGEILNAGFVKHFGKALTVERWERKCDYYASHFPKYSEKWKLRKGKSVHTKSDFGMELIRWEEKEYKGIKLTPAIEASNHNIDNRPKASSASRLKILLTNHHLTDFTGSELYTYTLASYLSEFGHEVVVYSKYIGKIREIFDRAGIKLVDNLESIKNNSFDVSHVHHNINAMEVRSAFPSLPIIFLSHGILPFLEQPPIIDLGISKFLCVSEEVELNLIRKGVKKDKIEVVRNLIDPKKFTVSRKINMRPQKALIISGRIDSKKENIISEACHTLNITCRFVGGKFGAVLQEDIVKLINEADIVFSLGRGAVESMFCGRIPIIYDYLGGDGMVMPSTFNEIKKNNFSGRRYKKEFTVQQLVNEINKYDAAFGLELRSLAIKEFSAEILVHKLIALYKSITATRLPVMGKSEMESLNFFIQSLNETKNYSFDLGVKHGINSAHNETAKVLTHIYNLLTNGKNDEVKNMLSQILSSVAPHNNAAFVESYTDVIANNQNKKNLPEENLKGNPQDAVDISIIIPTFNKWEYTEKCLNSISETCDSVSYEIIVVDNGSTDGTRERLRKLREGNSNLIVIKNSENLGYAKANNIGAQKSSGKYLVFLNNDTVAYPGWIEAGVKRLESSLDVGIVGAKLLYPDRTIQHCGITFIPSDYSEIPIWPAHKFRSVNENDKNVIEANTQIAVTGACMFIRKELFIQLRGFDESYGMYFEDIDLCFKASQAGKQIYYEPTCVLIHYEGKSGVNRSEIDRQNISSSKIFYAKWKNTIDKLARKELDSEVVWIAPFFNPSGYASEAIGFALGLDKYVNLTIRNQNPFVSNEFINNLPQHWKNVLFRLHKVEPHKWTESFKISQEAIIIHHQPGSGLIKFNNAKFCIGRTMYETDRIPESWIGKCNEMDEIWVPSKFNVDTFSKCGVDRNKLVVIPESIDTEVFDPEKVEKYELPNKAAFNFLSVFEWTNRKGWDVLLKTYFETFTNKDDVCLFLRTYLLGNYDSDTTSYIQNKINSLIIKSGYSKSKLPKLELLTTQLSFEEMLRLYKSVDAFVLPSRGEGWGRPYMEAMSMSLPVIGTNWSGNTEFMTNENSYLIDVEKFVEIRENEIDSYLGHKWAQPSVKHLKKLLLEVSKNPEKAKEKGLQARKDIVEKFNLDAVAKIVVKRLKQIENKIQPAHESCSDTIKNIDKENIAIVWEGPQFVNHSLALVNREMCSSLVQLGYNLSLLKTEQDSFGFAIKSKYGILNESNKKKLDKVNIHVRHHWPPNLTPPALGYWVVIQPWEFGSLPKSWAEVFSTQVDEMWVPSNYVRQIYLDAGVSPDRVFVVPNGFDADVFNSNNKPFKLKTKKKFKFLFVGGTIYRKGIDILINAYTESFKNTDDVCLIIKDFGGDSFYKNQTIKEQIQKIRQNKKAPQIEYMDKTLTEKEIAGLYTACDVLVHPYRGEGFGLPILEAMASGLPVMVTNGGACLDFCNNENSILILAEKRFSNGKKVDSLETVDFPWLYEPSLQDLKEKLIWAYNQPERIKAVGKKAEEFALKYFRWDNSSKVLEERINAISKKTIIREAKIISVNKNDGENVGHNFVILLNEFLQKAAENNLVEADNMIGNLISSYSQDIHETIIKYEELFNLVANIKLALGELTGAADYFEKQLNLNPNSSSACFGLGEVFYLNQKYSEAKTMYEWALSLEPRNEKAASGLQKVNDKLASTSPDDNNSSKEDTFVLVQKIIQSIRILVDGNYIIESEKAIKQCETILDSLEGEKKSTLLSELQYLKGASAFKLSDYEASRQHYERALSLNPESSETCAGLGEIFIAEDKIEAAKTMFEWSLKFEPENKQAVNRMNEINNLETQTEDLITDFKQDNELTDKLYNFLSAIDSLVESCEYEKSLNLLKQAQQHFSELETNESTELLQSAFAALFGFVQFGLNNIDDAKSSFEEALQLNPKSSEACRGLGECFLKNDLLDEAKTMLEWAVKNDPSNQKAISMLTKLNGQPDKVSEKSSLLVEKEEVLREAYNLFSEKKYNDAIALLRRTEKSFNGELKAEANNAFASAMFNLKGFNYLALNLLNDAQQSFQKALHHNPKSPKACYGLGEIFFINKDDKSAKTMFEWAVKNDPTDKLALDGLKKTNRILNFNEFHNSLLE